MAVISVVCGALTSAVKCLFAVSCNWGAVFTNDLPVPRIGQCQSDSIANSKTHVGRLNVLLMGVVVATFFNRDPERRPDVTSQRRESTAERSQQSRRNRTEGTPSNCGFHTVYATLSILHLGRD